MTGVVSRLRGESCRRHSGDPGQTGSSREPASAAGSETLVSTECGAQNCTADRARARTIQDAPRYIRGLTVGLKFGFSRISWVTSTQAAASPAPDRGNRPRDYSPTAVLVAPPWCVTRGRQRIFTALFVNASSVALLDQTKASPGRRCDIFSGVSEPRAALAF